MPLRRPSDYSRCGRSFGCSQADSLRTVNGYGLPREERTVRVQDAGYQPADLLRSADPADRDLVCLASSVVGILEELCVNFSFDVAGRKIENRNPVLTPFHSQGTGYRG